MKPHQVREYYAREDIQNFFIEFSKDREIVGVFRNGSFSSRPNSLNYKEDISALVKTGVMEFHSSLEHWKDIMSLKPTNYKELRNGWDFIIDLDCKVFEYSKIMAKAVCDVLEKHGIKNFSIKYTGGTGFHIGIPWGSFPKTVNRKPIGSLYPELPIKMVEYLKDYLRSSHSKYFASRFSYDEVPEKTGKPLDAFIDDIGRIDPLKIVEVDTVLLSPRHLFRMPYSLNRKTMLASLPIKPGKIEDFMQEQSDPFRIKIEEGFLDFHEEEEVSFLVTEAMNWASKRKVVKKEVPEKIAFDNKVSEKDFPPCMKNILLGLEDGRKRSAFILINFLKSLGWKQKEIEQMLLTWNQKNKPPLGENYIRSQTRWHKDKDIKPPPNCKNDGYYPAFGVCTPDERCGFDKKSIKNPIKYVVVGFLEKQAKSKKKK